MLDLMESVLGQCPGIAPEPVEYHSRVFPGSYFERYSATDIARHLRLLARLADQHPIHVEVRALAARAFEVIVVGIDCSGALACITAAVTAHGFDFEDVQVATSHEQAGPAYFVVVLRVSGPLHGQSLAELASAIRERLEQAFAYLAQGNLTQAQALAADTCLGIADVSRHTPRPSLPASARVDPYEGMLLGGDFRLERRLTTGGQSQVYL